MTTPHGPTHVIDALATASPPRLLSQYESSNVTKSASPDHSPSARRYVMLCVICNGATLACVVIITFFPAKSRHKR